MKSALIGVKGGFDSTFAAIRLAENGYKVLAVNFFLSYLPKEIILRTIFSLNIYKKNQVKLSIPSGYHKYKIGQRKGIKYKSIKGFYLNYFLMAL